MLRLRVSLKWFLLGTTLVCVLAGTFGKQFFDDWYLRQWLERQQTIAKELTAGGCKVKMTNGRVVDVTIPANRDVHRLIEWVAQATELERLEIYSPAADEDIGLLADHAQLRVLGTGGEGITNRSLEIIGKLPRLESVWIANSRANDEGLRQLRGLTELRHVCIAAWPNFNGDGLKHLASLQKLKSLQLYQMNVRHGQGLAELNQVESLDFGESGIELGVLSDAARMPNLKSLGLGQAKVSDESLAELKDARQLERIAFTAATVSDKGMVHLYDLKQLQQITVAMSKVTPQGARELRKHLPNTEITE